MKQGYFDYAAATPLDERVLQAMMPYLTSQFYNPSSTYTSAQDVRSSLNDARSTVAGVLGVKAREIVFTSGCTEANNTAIQGIMRLYPHAKVLVSAVEHDSVYQPATNFNHAVIPILESGIIDVEKCKKMLTDDVVLVSCMYANNEIGTVQPLRVLSGIIKEERARRGSKGLPIYLHTDAAQAVNYLDLHINGLGVDMMSLNGSKMYGPKGSGCLYVSHRITLEPILYGGGQEFGKRSGTENTAASIGLSRALELAQEDKDLESKRLSVLQSILVERLTALGGTVNGNLKRRLPNNLSVAFEGIDSERLVFALDAKGLMVSSGSACHARAGAPSRVLAAIGLSDKLSQSTIRISMGRYTTIQDVEKLIYEISLLVAKNR